MAKPKSVLVRVPATTANLGPGFDCLGLALDIWNEIEFSISRNSLKIEIEGEGSNTLPRDDSNLIYQCMQTLSRSASQSLPDGIRIKCRNNIPVSSGLGSSSAAVIAGLLGAKNLLNLQISDHELLKTALSFEGHADNISACLFGGLTITALSAGELVVKKLAIKPLNAVIALPNVNLSTRQARAVLPETLSMKDAVFNIGRAALLINALQDSNYDLMKIAMEDRLHQPYRLGLIPGTEAAISEALEAGALGAALSGAGPGVIAFIEKGDKKVGETMVRVFKNANMAALLFTTTTTNQSAQVIMKA
ncbi:MAG: homoserine kinase [Pelolinea sp.]|nr:homoserine kinase [Pelolinea sp.]